jgi:hypothetical protein
LCFGAPVPPRASSHRLSASSLGTGRHIRHVEPVLVKFGEHHMNSTSAILPVDGTKTKLARIRPSSPFWQLIGGLDVGCRRTGGRAGRHLRGGEQNAVGSDFHLVCCFVRDVTRCILHTCLVCCWQRGEYVVVLVSGGMPTPVDQSRCLTHQAASALSSS